MAAWFLEFVGFVLLVTLWLGGLWLAFCLMTGRCPGGCARRYHDDE